MLKKKSEQKSLGSKVIFNFCCIFYEYCITTALADSQCRFVHPISHLLEELGRDLGTISVQLTEADDSGRRSVPLSAQYLRPFEHRYRGLQLTFSYSGKGLFRIIGVAIELRS